MLRVILIVSVLFHAAAVQGAPVEVVFFPDAARVTEKAQVNTTAGPGDMKTAVITLPAAADPDTLVLSLLKGPGSVEDQKIRQVTRQDEEKIASLRKRLEEEKEVRRKIQAAMKAADVQVEFWKQQTKTKLKTLADIGNLASAVSRNTQKAALERLHLERDLEKTDRRIAEIQAEIEAAAGKKEKVWEVSVILSGVKSPQVSLLYTYHLGGCGWLPLYRLEAKPLEKTIAFFWEAEIWQSSGRDFRDVSVRLANVEPPRGLDPKEIPPWIIQPRPVFLKAAKSGAARRTLMEERTAPDNELEEEAAAAGAPVQVREGSYSAWDLGKRSIPAGERQKVRVTEEQWPAEFVYLGRPSRGGEVFVRGVVSFADAREIPKGNGVFLLDGAIVGKRPFGFSGKEGRIHFGIDPFVKVREVLVSRKGGETFLGGSVTQTWEWCIELENSRPYPVRMRVESPLPQGRDERIKISLKNDPEPAEKTEGLMTWLTDLPAGGRGRILSSVLVEAPKDLPLDLGWR